MFIIYFYLNNKRLTVASKCILLLGSMIFYGYYNIVYIPILMGSIIFNYMIGDILRKARVETRTKMGGGKAIL